MVSKPCTPSLAKSSLLIYQFIGQKPNSYMFNDNRQMQSAMETQKNLNSLLSLTNKLQGKKEIGNQPAKRDLRDYPNLNKLENKNKTWN